MSQLYLKVMITFILFFSFQSQAWAAASQAENTVDQFTESTIYLTETP